MLGLAPSSGVPVIDIQFTLYLSHSAQGLLLRHLFIEPHYFGINIVRIHAVLDVWSAHLPSGVTQSIHTVHLFPDFRLGYKMPFCVHVIGGINEFQQSLIYLVCLAAMNGGVCHLNNDSKGILRHGETTVSTFLERLGRGGWVTC